MRGRLPAFGQPFGWSEDRWQDGGLRDCEKDFERDLERDFERDSEREDGPWILAASLMLISPLLLADC